MVGGNWLDPDGLYRQYGTTKAVPEVGGDFLRYGEYRMQEYTIDLTTLTPNGTNIIPSNTTFIPVGVYVESVEIDVELAAVGVGALLNIGEINNDRVTVASATGFVNAMTTATMTQGAKIILTGGSTFAGGYIGTVAGTPTPTGYLIANSATAVFTQGKIKVRINYRTTTTITQ